MSNDISYEEWLKELNKRTNQEASGEGLTTAEIAAINGETLIRVRKRIKEGLQLGLVRPGTKYIRTMGGYGSLSPRQSWIINAPDIPTEKASKVRKAAKKVRKVAKPRAGSRTRR